MKDYERFTAYRDEIAVRLCNVLYDLPEGSTSLTRFQLGARLFGPGHRGGSIVASVIGSLKTRGVLDELPPRFREPGVRFALTESGRAQVAWLRLVGVAA